MQERRWSESSDEIVLEQYVCEMLGSRIGDEVGMEKQITDTLVILYIAALIVTVTAVTAGRKL